jgi:uncharacterized protein YukE
MSTTNDQSDNGNPATGSINGSVYYEAYMAISTFSTSLLYSEQTMAEYSNMLADMLNDIYSEANSVLAADASKVANTKSDHQQADQNEYSNDSTYFQNLETEFNSMVDSGNTAVNNLANAQTQLAQLGSTMNGDLTYMSNLLASPLAG